jgi:hypothetical protein
MIQFWASLASRFGQRRVAVALIEISAVGDGVKVKRILPLFPRAPVGLANRRAPVGGTTLRTTA